jgi:hypothetical protein
MEKIRDMIVDDIRQAQRRRDSYAEPTKIALAALCKRLAADADAPVALWVQ